MGMQVLLWNNHQVELPQAVFELSIPVYIQAALDKFPHKQTT